VPCLSQKEKILLSVELKLETVDKSKHWNIHLPGIEEDSEGIDDEFMSVCRNVECYFTKMYRKAESASFYFNPQEDEPQDTRKCHTTVKFTDSAQSVMLGIFLAAVKEMMGSDFKDKWQSVTVTGTFKKSAQKKELDGKLTLEHIKEIDEKLIAFINYAKDDERKNETKKHLFIYITEEDDDENDWENYIVNEDKKLVEKIKKYICVKPFSTKKDTLFDILDFVFEFKYNSLPNGSFESKEKAQEDLFRNFEAKTEDIIKRRHIESQSYPNKTLSDKLEDGNSIFIYGLSGSGKSYLAVQLARYLVWNKKIYAPIWINIEYIQVKDKSDDNTDKRIPVEIQEKLFLSLNDKNVTSCIKKLEDIPYLIIIDDIPDSIVDDFLKRITEFRATIEKNTRIIFISTAKPNNNERIRNMELIQMPLETRQIKEEPDKSNKITKSNLHFWKKHKVLIRSAILLLLVFLLFIFSYKSNIITFLLYSIQSGDIITIGIHSSSSNPIPLKENKWRNDSISKKNNEVWYSFNVTQGNEYFIWLNNSSEGDGTKTLSPNVIHLYSNGDNIYNRDNTFFYDYKWFWNRPRSFTAKSTDSVYIKVLPDKSDYTGTYGIAYSTTSNRPKWTPPFNPKHLTDKKWINSNISIINRKNWYSFNVTQGNEYYIWVNNSYEGDGTKTLYAEVTALYNNGDSIFFQEKGMWNEPQSFIAESTGKVYVGVFPFLYFDTGTYSIAYSTSKNRPGLWVLPSNPPKLTENQWKNGNISKSNSEAWYSFNVTKGEEYYIWSNHKNDGDSTKTLSARITALYSNWDSIVTDHHRLWTFPRSFTARSDDTVYVRVLPKSSSDTGTFGIVYTTNDTRPDVP
jgi:DNA replication protein DnaC